MKDRYLVWLVCTVCVVSMAAALGVLRLGGDVEVDGTISDRASCVAAGATYVAHRDECAFTTNITVAAGHTLVLGSGLSAVSFRRAVDVRGTLVAHSAVTATDGLGVTGTADLRGPTSVRVLAEGRDDRSVRVASGEWVRVSGPLVTAASR